jgi:hypothetical protein
MTTACSSAPTTASVPTIVITSASQTQQTAPSNSVIPPIPTSPLLTSISASPIISVLVPSAKDEVDRVWNTLKQINFYDQYSYKPVFPSFPEMDAFLQKARANQLGDVDYDNLSVLMQKTFVNDNYAKAYRNVIDSLPVVDQVFPIFGKYSSKWGFNIFPTYTVQLTLYGMGGSYNPQADKVILLVTQEGKFLLGNSPTQTIIHEMVHIGIEECIVQSYSLGQKTKERIVDLFCHYHFLSLVPDYHMQLYQDTSIDPYLKGEGAWDNLPTVIKEFKTK